MSRGRIRSSDITLVRERANIAEFIGEHLTLRNAGSGNMKGLCPFHEESSPSFNVSPARGVYYCFGCGEGGDVLTFIQKLNMLSFTEAVEYLADRTGVTLTYTDPDPGSVHTPPRDKNQRRRLLALNAAAAEFYAQQLSLPSAVKAREFLTGRGFSREAAREFRCGFAPDGWDMLTQHLYEQGFTREELVTAGVSKEARSGSLIDRFRRRLIWPIRETTGDVIGFGGRKLFDEDDSPKYLNTPQTPLYNKSRVLYGVDRAKRDIAQSKHVVIVEGYTDVMACHLAGVKNAVATCGTAFGVEHVGVVRRLLMDHDAMRGRVIFTFDGDAAGQKAAHRAFEQDSKFAAGTYVAISPEGTDPCELRQRSGDTAVREMIARAEPLLTFVLRSMVAEYDTASVAGRTAAIDAISPLIAQVYEQDSRLGYVRLLAGLLGMDVEEVRRAVLARARGVKIPASSGSGPRRPHVEDTVLSRVERDLLRVAIQHPQLAGEAFDALTPEMFTHTEYAAVFNAIAKAGGVTGEKAQAGEQQWVHAVQEICDDLVVGSCVQALAVEPHPHQARSETPEKTFVDALITRVRLIDAERGITAAKAALQRMNPMHDQEAYRQAFSELIALEASARQLREHSVEAG